MIWILGGTHEVPLLLGELKSYDNIVVTVTTDEAREFFCCRFYYSKYWAWAL